MLSSGHCTQALTASEVTCTRPEQDRASQHCGMDREGAWEAPFLVKERLQMMAAGGRGVSLLIESVATIDCPCSSEWPNHRVHVSSANWTQLV